MEHFEVLFQARIDSPTTFFKSLGVHVRGVGRMKKGKPQNPPSPHTEVELAYRRYNTTVLRKTRRKEKQGEAKV